MKKFNEIRTRNNKEDDIVISDVDIHLEDMDGKNWWLGVYKGKKRTTFWIRSKSKITIKSEENELGLKLSKLPCGRDHRALKSKITNQTALVA